MCGNVPRVRIPPSPPVAEFYRHGILHPVGIDSRVLCNRGSRTPSGPGGSSGSDPLCVLRVPGYHFFELNLKRERVLMSGALIVKAVKFSGYALKIYTRTELV